ncbi:MAG: chorismate synthase [Firmicutes bacterium]|nr:chorismate synthase [Bacillota bacterium]
MRFLTAGESHGPALTAVIEGLPAQLPLTEEAINNELARRQRGYGRGGRMQIEQDRAEVLSGLRFGCTLGTPLTLLIHNRDYANWQETMAPFGREPEKAKIITQPRPGHADLAGALKYGFTDLRCVLERASARETAARVAVGAVAKALLAAFGIEVYSYVEAIGGVTAPPLEPAALKALAGQIEKSPVRCHDAQAEAEMLAAIEAVKSAGDSLGGVFVVVALGVPVGLGSHVQWDRKLDGRLAAALMSIQAIKGVEIGSGFAAAARPGSLVHDEIFWQPEQGYFRKTNNAGGLEGGISNGEPIVCRAAMKPIPTLKKPLSSVNMQDHTPYAAAVERSDVCAVPAAAVVGEAAVAWELAAALKEKLGGDSLPEMLANYEAYRKYLAAR